MRTLKLPDGSIRQVPDGTRLCDVAASIGKRLARLQSVCRWNEERSTSHE